MKASKRRQKGARPVMAQPSLTEAPGGPPPTGVRYRVLTWLCAAAMIAYIHRNSIGVVEENIRSDLGLSKEEMGWLMGAFFLTYSLLQIPAGWLGDCRGTRRALPFFALVGSAALGVAGLAASVPALWLSRLGMGAAQSGLFPCSVKTVGAWFPQTQRGLANGALGSFMSIGSAVGAGLTGLLLAYLSWQGLFLLYFLPGALWAAGFYAWFRDRPQDHWAVNQAEVALIQGPGPHQPAGAPPEPAPWRALLTCPDLWWICGQQFLRAAGYTFFASWFPTFLKETRGVTTVEAGLLTSLPFWAVVLGSFAGGALSDWLQLRTGSRRLSRQGLAVVGLLLCALFILAAGRAAGPLAAVLLMSAGTFWGALAGPCAYTITIDLGGRHVATVFSTMNMCGNLGAVAFPVVVPWLILLGGSWDVVLFVFAGLYLAAALCWLMVDTGSSIFGAR